MLLLTVVLLSAAILNQSLGEEEEEEEKEEGGELVLPGSGVSPKLQQQFVDKLNDLRRKVAPTARNMLKVVWNETVAENAKKWADQCTAHSSPIELRTFDDVMCGQTVSQSDPASTWDEIVGYWASKKNDFKYGVGRINPRVNIHSYTQAIWYNSYMVGCGVSYCPKNKFPFLYICQYCPAGNIRGQMERPYKKGPPCGDCPKNCDKKLCTNPCKYVDRIETCKKLKSVMGCKAANKDGLCKATCKCRNKIK